MTLALPAGRIRLLSYNIQIGIESCGYHSYLLQGWKHLLPHPQRQQNLQRIASLLGNYDLVALQEVDGGSLRSGGVDQTRYLAHTAGFPFWRKQVNRNVGRLARHSNGFLSRYPPDTVEGCALPGLPGRGAMIARFGGEGHAHQLVVCMLHLALGRRNRARQLAFIAERLSDAQHLVVMGDLNCDCDAPEVRTLTRSLGLIAPDCQEDSFPSWRPARRLDHILISPELHYENPRVLDYPLSDHLPVSLDLQLPPGPV